MLHIDEGNTFQVNKGSHSSIISVFPVMLPFEHSILSPWSVWFFSLYLEGIIIFFKPFFVQSDQNISYEKYTNYNGFDENIHTLSAIKHHKFPSWRMQHPSEDITTPL
jgi:hypothetical protein